MTEQPKQEKKQPNHLSKYTGIAVKMASILLLGVFAGYKLDEFLEFDAHPFTILFSLGACILSMYIIIKEVSQ
ncbi:MAG: hypothetical protein CMO34_06915 [Verrucomicrobia bacterium]|nr:hypothetical protein [Verrucomicrobiota bacterium]